MKQVLHTIRIYLFFTFVLGVIYPVMMTGAAQILFPLQANGSLIRRESRVLGSKLIGQPFQKPDYFWPRPSAGDYNPLPSGGSNLGPTSKDLQNAVGLRRARLTEAHGAQAIPQDLLFASGSGLDPHISPEAAAYQAARVAQARGRTSAEILERIHANTRARDLGVLGEPVVNVLELNLDLDRRFGEAR